MKVFLIVVGGVLFISTGIVVWMLVTVGKATSDIDLTPDEFDWELELMTGDQS